MLTTLLPQNHLTQNPTSYPTPHQSPPLHAPTSHILSHSTPTVHHHPLATFPMSHICHSVLSVNLSQAVISRRSHPHLPFSPHLNLPPATRHLLADSHSHSHHSAHQHSHIHLHHLASHSPTLFSSSRVSILPPLLYSPILPLMSSYTVQPPLLLSKPTHKTILQHSPIIATAPNPTHPANSHFRPSTKPNRITDTVHFLPQLSQCVAYINLPTPSSFSNFSLPFVLPSNLRASHANAANIPPY